MMEKLTIAKSRILQKGDTILCATRYGNVMASRGSVIPLFVNQIKEGRELTITDPTMTRFLMSLEDSVDLVLFAYQRGRQGDIFVQKAPAATVAVLAEAVKSVLGRTGHPVSEIGTRHGEKLFEALLSREELATAIDEGGYFRVPADGRDLNYSKFVEEGEKRLNRTEDYHSHNTERLDVEGMKALLMKVDYVRRAASGETAGPED